jgi:CRISPR/Cas system-associated protein Cas7 (RAMP superfamily)
VAVSKRIAKLLAKDPRFRRKFGTPVPTTASIKKQLGKTQVSRYAKDGGYIVKKKKKVVKKRKK